jgi:hypothetical protein
MPQLVLSTGVKLQSESVRMAAYYPAGSLRNDGVINGLLIRHKENFLVIRLADSVEHVRGTGAVTDADALERAGVKVHRRPLPVLRAS